MHYAAESDGFGLGLRASTDAITGRAVVAAAAVLSCPSGVSMISTSFLGCARTLPKATSLNFCSIYIYTLYYNDIYIYMYIYIY